MIRLHTSFDRELANRFDDAFDPSEFDPSEFDFFPDVPDTDDAELGRIDDIYAEFNGQERVEDHDSRFGPL